MIVSQPESEIFDVPEVSFVPTPGILKETEQEENQVVLLYSTIRKYLLRIQRNSRKQDLDSEDIQQVKDSWSMIQGLLQDSYRYRDNPDVMKLVEKVDTNGNRVLAEALKRFGIQRE